MIESDRKLGHELNTAADLTVKSIIRDMEAELKKPVDPLLQENLHELLGDDTTSRVVVIKLDESELLAELVDATALLVQFYLAMVCLPLGIVLFVIGLWGWKRREALIEKQISSQIAAGAVK